MYKEMGSVRVIVTACRPCLRHASSAVFTVKQVQTPHPGLALAPGACCVQPCDTPQYSWS